MDSMPYGFLEQLCSTLSDEQLRGILELNAPLWMERAATHLRKRKYFTVTVKVFPAPRSAEQNGDRHSVSFWEIQKDGAPGEGEDRGTVTFEDLKTRERRFLRLRRINFIFEHYRGEAVTTNFEEIVNFITSPALMDKNSALSVLSPEDWRLNTNGLLRILNTEKFLAFRKLCLFNEGGDICERILPFQILNNTHLNKLVMRGDQDWLREDKPCVARFVNKKGPKSLFVVCDDVLQNNATYIKQWLRDPTFEFELNIGQNFLVGHSVAPYLHRLDDDFYGLVHPNDSRACVWASVWQQHGHELFSMKFARDNARMLETVSEECQKSQCYLCQQK
uniref:FBA_2 domain-containing protein n=1 Tax=Steinernema glaseri TaxID=37863 RepID=A0A1I7YIY2_9BILA